MDYYEVLQCNRNTSDEEIKKNYQRLILSCHPDKIEGSKNNEAFILIHKAWSVLREPQSRKQYDAILSSEEHSELLLFDVVCISDLEYNDCDGVYSCNCRCGGKYAVQASELVPPKVVIGCDECSFSIQINIPP